VINVVIIKEEWMTQSSFRSNLGFNIGVGQAISIGLVSTGIFTQYLQTDYGI
jgi:hypothetical protein